jgi:hypothetical protein
MYCTTIARVNFDFTTSRRGFELNFDSLELQLMFVNFKIILKTVEHRREHAKGSDESCVISVHGKINLGVEGHFNDVVVKKNLSQETSLGDAGLNRVSV